MAELDRDLPANELQDGIPHGWKWRLTTPFTARSRGRRYAMFMETMQPGPDETILDVGVTDADRRASNFLEAMYPRPGQITAVALDDAPAFRRLFPEVDVVVADGRSLPFPDGAFDIGFSNAVIEHVGGRADQRRYAAELVRTCRRVFIATPNSWFPIDPHTLLPLIHWLPRTPRDLLLRATGNGRWAGEANLNPLTASQLRALFPPRVPVRIARQRVAGFTTVLVAIVDADQRSGARPALG